jgi:hypothetical protein
MKDQLFDGNPASDYSSNDQGVGSYSPPDYSSGGNSDVAAAKAAKNLGTYGKAFSGIASLISAYGKYSSLTDKSKAEAENADFYTQEATFAAEAGERRKMIFNNSSQVLYGEQLSGFAKAGVDISQSSRFMANQMLQRNQGEWAITQDEAKDVKLAQLRADAANQNSKDLAIAAPLGAIGSLASLAALI